MFILDSFHGYLYEKLKVQFEGKNCVLVVIPSGMASQCIPLNVSVSKQLKDNLRMEYEASLLSENHPLIPCINIEWASPSPPMVSPPYHVGGI
jgi:hypothetical protein